jgi:hypothetical protein
MKKIIIALFAFLPLISQSQNKPEQKDQAGFTYSVQKPLAASQDEFTKNYNTGIAYYNRAVKRIEKAKSGSANDKAAVEKETKTIFGQGLPFLEKAYQLDPLSKNVLTALSGIYFSMNETEKFKKMQSELVSPSVK